MDAVATFPPEWTSPAQARHFVGGVIHGACPRTVREVAVLLTSELAANAVLHARTDFRVRVHLDDGSIRVEVLDDNPRAPVVAEVPVDAASGRGLALLQQLSADWGVVPCAGGKVVWFEVALDLR